MCRYQEFYNNGERETLLEEILNLRDQVCKQKSFAFENLLSKLERDYYEGMKGMTLSTVDWFQVLEIMDAKLALEQGAVALSTTQVYSLNPSQPTWNKYLEHKTSVFWLVRFLWIQICRLITTEESWRSAATIWALAWISMPRRQSKKISGHMMSLLTFTHVTQCACQLILVIYTSQYALFSMLLDFQSATVSWSCNEILQTSGRASVKSWAAKCKMCWAAAGTGVAEGGEKDILFNMLDGVEYYYLVCHYFVWTTLHFWRGLAHFPHCCVFCCKNLFINIPLNRRWNDGVGRLYQCQKRGKLMNCS